jgi:hypothetical protein
LSPFPLVNKSSPEGLSRVASRKSGSEESSHWHGQANHAESEEQRELPAPDPEHPPASLQDDSRVRYSGRSNIYIMSATIKMMAMIKSNPNPPLGKYPQCALYGQLGNAPKRKSTNRMITIVRSMFLFSSRSEFSRNFRSGPLVCASYASPAIDTTNLPPELVPTEIATLW